MINFIIDTSVFSLPSKSNNPETERDYLNTLIKNMKSYKRIERNNSITISYMNKIPVMLRENNHFVNKGGIRERINELLIKRNENLEEIGHDSVLFEDWDSILIKINKRKLKNTDKYVKGRIGIFKNIPNREKDFPDDHIFYQKWNERKDLYPKLPNVFYKKFEVYCGYIAYLNHTYFCNNNFIILGNNQGNMDKKDINVPINDKNILVIQKVSVIGIRKAENLCLPKIEAGNLQDVCRKVIEKFSGNLEFGAEVNNTNIIKNLSPCAGPPEKIYRYLETLSNVYKLIINKTVNISNDYIFIEMLNAHGLLCSLDNEKYMVNKCECRKYKDKFNKKLLFNIHLKPVTYTNKSYDPEYDDETYTMASEFTVRIYIKWDNSRKKIVVGWIGHHPSSCEDCINNNCAAKNALNTIKKLTE